MEVLGPRSLWYLIFFGFWTSDLLRNNINLAVIAMVKPKYLNESYVVKQQLETTKNQTVFDWDEYDIGYILSSYYWLHWVTQLPGGLYGRFFGSKFLFTIANLSSALTTLLIPLAAKEGLIWLLALRVLDGFIGGAVLPSLHEMVAKWIPQKDRPDFLSSYLGSSVGIATCYILGGTIIEIYGWEAMFYIQGVFGLILWCFFLVLVFLTPSHDTSPPFERRSIALNMVDWTKRAKQVIPWESILSSGPLWINMSTQFGVLWGDFALLNLTPIYFNFVYGFNVSSTGLIVGIPFITKWMFSVFLGKIFKDQYFLSIFETRKLATILCTIPPGIFILMMANTVGHVFWATVYMMLAITFQGAIPAGPMGTLIDLSPNFASILQGISGAVGALSGLLGPLILAYLTKNAYDHIQWVKFFWITAIVCFYCGVIDLLCGTSNLQHWNDSRESSDSDTQKGDGKKHVF